MRTFVPTYRPTGSALHAARVAVAALYVGGICLAAVALDNPLLLAALLAGVVGAAAWAGVGRELAIAARLALPLALLVAIVNPLVSREGLTVIAEGPVVPVLGALDITLEALVFGLVAGLRVLVVVLAFALFSAAVDPDRLLALVRRLSFRSALTASLATRLVPVIARDATRLADAYTLRAAEPVTGRMPRLHRGAVLTRALTAGALERAVDVAAALEVRGYGSAPRRARAGTAPWSRHDTSFLLAALLIVAGSLVARGAGAAHFDAYPMLDADWGPLTWALAAATTATLLAPFAWAAAGRRRRDRAA